MTPESRYSSSDEIFVPAHRYTDVGEAEVDTKSDSAVVHTDRAIYRLVTLPLPDPPPASTRAKVTSYMHLYAQDRYGDAEKWWLIADANPQIRYPLDIRVGQRVFLP
jgi:hypothetical protein